MTERPDLKDFLAAIAELADGEGVAAEVAVRERYGDRYAGLWDHATERRYLKPAEPGRIALTTMGRFAAGTLG